MNESADGKPGWLGTGMYVLDPNARSLTLQAGHMSGFRTVEGSVSFGMGTVKIAGVKRLSVKRTQGTLEVHQAGRAFKPLLTESGDPSSLCVYVGDSPGVAAAAAGVGKGLVS